MRKQFKDSININAIKEAKAFEARVDNWRNDIRNEQITKQNKMSTRAYMKDINERGYKTELDEVDFHKVQRATLLPTISQYVMFLSEQYDIQVSLLLELLKLREPEKFEELTKDFDKAMEQDNAHYKKDEHSQTKKEENKDMNMVKGLNKREETNLTALIVAGLDGVFQKVRTSNEIMYAVFQKEIEDLRLKQVEAVREEKVETPENVAKIKNDGI